MYPMTSLSPRRQSILSFIQERALIHGQPPSLAEIAAACGLASRGAARKQVLALAEAGLIELTPGQARGIRPAGSASRQHALSVPILGRVAAGVPIGADAELVDTLSLDIRLFSQRPDYLLRVQGDSMIEDGILDGDLVGVHRTSEARWAGGGGTARWRGDDQAPVAGAARGALVAAQSGLCAHRGGRRAGLRH